MRLFRVARAAVSPAEARNSLLTRLRSAAGCDPPRLIVGIGRYEHVAFVQLILNLV